MSAPPEQKPRLCTICKQPRVGHPRSGCPNSIVIPITQPLTTTTGASVQIQATAAPSITTPVPQYQPGNPQGFSMPTIDHIRMRQPTPALYSRASSVKPTPTQLYEEELHAMAYLNQDGGRAWSHNPAVIPEALRGDQWPLNDEWQLILAGHLNPQGHWVVTTRDVGGFSSQVAAPRAPIARPSLPASAPPPTPTPANQVLPSAPTATNSGDFFKFLFAILFGAVLGLYGVTRI